MRKRSKQGIVGVLVLVIVCTGCTKTLRFSALSSNALLPEEQQKKVTVMGYDYYLHLFDLKKYQEEVAPAYQEFLEKNNSKPLIILLREIIQLVDKGVQMPYAGMWGKASFEEDIGIMEGSVPYARKGLTLQEAKQVYATGNLSSKIVRVLCVPQYAKVNTEQNMGQTLLIPYLYKRSKWIKDVFTSVRQIHGEELKFSIGESTVLFTKEDLQEFYLELAKVQPPEEPKIKSEFNNLYSLLKLALEEPGLTLSLSLM